MPTPPKAPGLVGTAVVARRLGVTRQYAARLCERGVLPAVNVGTGRVNKWRVEPADLEAFVERRRGGPGRDGVAAPAAVSEYAEIGVG